MNSLKNIVAALFVSLFATAAAAQVSVGVSGNYIQMDGKGSETTSSETRTETLEMVYGSIFAEYSFGEFSIGVDYIPHTIQSETSANERLNDSVDTGRTQVQVDIEENFMVYGLINLPLDFSAYLKIGYSEADVLTNETMNTGSSYPDSTLSGTHISLGTEIDTGQGINMRAEAGWSSFDDITVTGTGGDGTANTVTAGDLSGPHARISLVKSF